MKFWKRISAALMAGAMCAAGLPGTQAALSGAAADTAYLASTEYGNDIIGSGEENTLQADSSSVAVNSVSSEDWEYTTDGVSATITGYTGTGGYIEVPSEIDGYAVTAIGENAFYDNDNLYELRVPEGVTALGDYAFGYCDNLATLYLPSSLTAFGYGISYDCLSLEGGDVYFNGTEAQWYAISNEGGNGYLLNYATIHFTENVTTTTEETTTTTTEETTTTTTAPAEESVWSLDKLTMYPGESVSFDASIYGAIASYGVQGAVYFPAATRDLLYNRLDSMDSGNSIYREMSQYASNLSNVSSGAADTLYFAMSNAYSVTPLDSDGTLWNMYLSIPDEDTVIWIAEQYGLPQYEYGYGMCYYEFPISWAEKGVDETPSGLLPRYAYLDASNTDVFDETVTLSDGYIRVIVGEPSVTTMATTTTTTTTTEAWTYPETTTTTWETTEETTESTTYTYTYEATRTTTQYTTTTRETTTTEATTSTMPVTTTESWVTTPTRETSDTTTESTTYWTYITTPTMTYSETTTSQTTGSASNTWETTTESTAFSTDFGDTTTRTNSETTTSQTTDTTSGTWDTTTESTTESTADTTDTTNSTGVTTTTTEAKWYIELGMPSASQLYVGNAFRILYSTNSARLSWSSSDSSIASIDAQGYLTIHAGGIVSIAAIAQEDPTKMSMLTLVIPEPAQTGTTDSTADTSTETTATTTTTTTTETDDFVRGDGDLNKAIDADDAYLALSYYANLSAGNGSLQFSTDAATQARILRQLDVDENDAIDADDAYYILYYYAMWSAGSMDVQWEEIIQ